MLGDDNVDININIEIELKEILNEIIGNIEQEQEQGQEQAARSQGKYLSNMTKRFSGMGGSLSQIPKVGSFSSFSSFSSFGKVGKFSKAVEKNLGTSFSPNIGSGFGKSIGKSFDDIGGASKRLLSDTHKVFSDSFASTYEKVKDEVELKSFNYKLETKLKQLYAACNGDKFNYPKNLVELNNVQQDVMDLFFNAHSVIKNDKFDNPDKKNIDLESSLKFLFFDFYTDDLKNTNKGTLLERQLVRVKSERKQMREKVFTSYSLDSVIRFDQQWFLYWQSKIIQFIGFIESNEAKSHQSQVVCLYFTRWLLNEILFKLDLFNNLDKTKFQEIESKYQDKLQKLDNTNLISEDEVSSLINISGDANSSYLQEFKASFNFWADNVIRGFYERDDSIKQKLAVKKQKQADKSRAQAQQRDLLLVEAKSVCDDISKLFWQNQREVFPLLSKMIDQDLCNGNKGFDISYLKNITWGAISEYSECKPYDLTPLSSYNSFYLNIESSLKDLEKIFLLECSKLVKSRNIHSSYKNMVLEVIDSYSNAIKFMIDNFRSEFSISRSNYESEYNKILKSYCNKILLFSILGKVENQISERASLCFKQYVDEMSDDLQKIKDLGEVLAIHYEKCKEFIVSSERDLLRQYDNSRLNDYDEIPLDIIDSKTDTKFLEYYNEFERIELESQIYKDKYSQGKYSDIADIINEVNYEGDVNRYKLLSLHTGIRSSINDLCSPIEGGISVFQILFKSYCERKTQFAQTRSARLLINFENRVMDPDADQTMELILENNLAIRDNTLGFNV